MPSFGTSKNVTLDDLKLYLLVPSWETRTLPFITFITPSENIFIADWIGDDRTTDKKVAIYDYPNRDDTATLDLGRSGTSLPLRIFFHGAGSDVIAKEFEDALYEKGKWQIIHPTKGIIRAQPLTFTLRDNPTESGGVYEIKTDFLESIDVEELTLGRGPNLLQSIFEALAIAARISALAVSVALSVQRAFSDIQAIRSTHKKSLDSIRDKLTSLARQSGEILAQFNSKVKEIESLLDNSVLDIEAIGSAMQDLIEIPTNVSTRFQQRFETYKLLTDDIFKLNPENTSIEDKNIVIAQELVLSAIINTNALIGTSSEYKSRGEAISATIGLRNEFNRIVANLDSVQTQFKDEFIKDQYFSNSTSYSNLAKITSKAIAFVYKTAFDLSVEKRIVLKKPTTVMNFVISEYGTLGENDEVFHDFVEVNKLQGDEILLMPTGREVVVYGR